MAESLFGGHVPVTEMAHCVAAHQRLHFTLQRLDEASASAPALPEGWTRAHVVAHLAAHAESTTRMLRGLLRDESIPQYAGGASGHRKAIDELVGLDAAALVDRYRASSEDLFGVWQEMPDDRWGRTVRTLEGSSEAAAVAWTRWHELEVRHVDLDLGFRPEDWPAAYVTTALGRFIEKLVVPREAPPPEGIWVIEVTDHERVWTIDTTASSSSSVKEGGASRAADGYLAGPAHAVLAWLLDRLVDQKQLRIDGSRADALGWLPRSVAVL